MKLRPIITALALALGAVQEAVGIDIDPDNESSVLEATKTVAAKLRALYPRGEPWFVPGEFGKITGKEDQGYYWWEGGAAMGAWIDYWAITGDDQYNDIVMEGMLHQVGPDNDYQPPNQTLSLGNDDQAFWGIAALSAAERGFPDPPEDKPQWLALAQAVFNRQALRWDDQTCDGGLRWQVFTSNKGYDYKNSVSNGLLFQMGARLARYTGNHTYAEWASKAYDWSKKSQLITQDFHIHDGLHVPDCVVTSKIMWSYNAGIYIAGAAFMYDYFTMQNKTPDASYWQSETQKLLEATDEPFFNRADGHPNVMRESGCEAAVPFDTQPTCNTDQRSFKGYLARFLAYAYQLAPFTQGWIMTRLRASAIAAGKSCTGQPDGNTCGLSWIMEKYDGSPYGIAVGGVGEHMGVMELFQNLMIEKAELPKTHVTGTSKGDPAAGSGNTRSPESLMQTHPTTTRDRIGAGIATAALGAFPFVLAWWLVFR